MTIPTPQESFQPIIEKVFSELKEAEISYALLRGHHELATTIAHGEDIDLLVAPEHLERLAQILAQYHFIARPLRHARPHHFFIAYDRASDGWIQFDVVTELCYGYPFFDLPFAMAKTFLANRCYCPLGFVLAPEDEFITLLLHCLLDKGYLREARQKPLLTLHQQITNDPPSQQRLLQLIQRYLEPALDWPIIAQALETQNWELLLHEYRLN